MYREHSLGFPLKLVLAKGHVFIRWDEGEGKERFNMEGTGGVDSLSDEHYREWPLPTSQEEVASGEYLKSLTPAEELASFLVPRNAEFAGSSQDGSTLKISATKH